MQHLAVILVFVVACVGVAKAADASASAYEACQVCKQSADASKIDASCQWLFSMDQSLAPTNLFCEYSGCADAKAPADFDAKCAILSDTAACFPDMAEADAKKELNFTTGSHSYHVPINAGTAGIVPYLTEDEMVALTGKVSVANILLTSGARLLMTTATPQVCQTWLQIFQNTTLHGDVVAAAPEKAVFFQPKSMARAGATVFPPPSRDACLFYTSTKLSAEGQVTEDVSGTMLYGITLKAVKASCGKAVTTTTSTTTSTSGAVTLISTTFSALLVVPLVASLAAIVGW